MAIIIGTAMNKTIIATRMKRKSDKATPITMKPATKAAGTTMNTLPFAPESAKRRYVLGDTLNGALSGATGNVGINDMYQSSRE